MKTYKELVESIYIDEKYIGFDKLSAKIGPRLASYIGRKKYGKEGMTDSKGEHKAEDKKMSAEKTNEETESNSEMTPFELGQHHAKRRDGYKLGHEQIKKLYPKAYKPHLSYATGYEGEQMHSMLSKPKS